ncbi:MAG: LPS assembly lipoprotein LptE [Burkholderiales bacterium]
MKRDGRKAALSWVVIAACVLLHGCGFHLRGAATLPFDTLFIPANHPMLIELSRTVRNGSNAKVVSDPKAAAATFALINEYREKVILSVNTAGRIREYQLRYAIVFRVHDGKGGEFVSPNAITLRRDITFNDQVLAKESEEVLLYREMQTDMVQQIIRRLQASKLRTPDDD